MQIAMVGLGRMGANMARRLMRNGHDCVVYDRNPEAVAQLVSEGATGAASLAELAEKLVPPRAVWIMVPSGDITENAVMELAAHFAAGDTIVDGGNSYFKDDVRRAKVLAERGIRYLDAGTSGGVWGLERGYCLMVGGDADAAKRLEPVFRTLAPGMSGIPPSPGRAGKVITGGSAEQGYLYCGPSGAGHFVKMVHNGIEYGVMAAYAEGMNILNAANAGKVKRDADAETSPLQNPEYYQFDIDLPAVAEVWRHGSVIGSWLLDLTAGALKSDPTLAQFGGRVSDSGEGRWTLKAAIDTGVPAPVLSSALFDRFSSQGESAFADKLLSAMRYAFGGHLEKPKA